MSDEQQARLKELRFKEELTKEENAELNKLSLIEQKVLKSTEE